MDQGNIKDVEDILHVFRLIDQLHDKQLITYEDFLSYKSNLNEKSHISVNALLGIS